MEPQLVATSDRPDLAEQGKAALLPGWPEFIFHDQVSVCLIGRAAEYFPQFDVRLLADGEVVAGAWAVALRWDGTPGRLPGGYDGALSSAIAEHERGTGPDTLCAMAAAVRPDQRGAGLGGQLLSALRDRAAAAGLTRVIAPVRPVLKSRYPLASMASFARWTRGDGAHLDPWIRTHQRLGATILGPAPRSMVVAGTVAEWQDWAGMAFPETGRYVVPGALDLVEIDTGRDRGTYAETNLWMRHA
ncbi:MAG TPA: GNAT family N-acetyltransferase [Trebonia sp.]